jgi:hypothetical protein
VTSSSWDSHADAQKRIAVKEALLRGHLTPFEGQADEMVSATLQRQAKAKTIIPAMHDSWGSELGSDFGDSASVAAMQEEVHHTLKRGGKVHWDPRSADNRRARVATEPMYVQDCFRTDLDANNAAMPAPPPAPASNSGALPNPPSAPVSELGSDFNDDHSVFNGTMFMN